MSQAPPSGMLVAAVVAAGQLVSTFIMWTIPDSSCIQFVISLESGKGGTEKEQRAKLIPGKSWTQPSTRWRDELVYLTLPHYMRCVCQANTHYHMCI